MIKVEKDGIGVRCSLTFNNETDMLLEFVSLLQAVSGSEKTAKVLCDAMEIVFGKDE